jgi:hypothetical protein
MGQISQIKRALVGDVLFNWNKIRFIGKSKSKYIKSRSVIKINWRIFLHLNQC